MGFVERLSCPACGCAARTTLISLRLCDAPIREYLETFYGRQGGVEMQYLQEGWFVLDECSECGLIYQRHILDADLMNRLYDQWINPACVRERNRKRQTLDSLISAAEETAMIAACCGRPPFELRFLDFGMGWGDWVRMVAALGINAYGCDLAESRQAHARSLGITVVPMDEISRHRFDFIHAEQVFEHLPTPLLTLRMLAGCLEPHGLIQISVPDGNGIKKQIADLSAAGTAWREGPMKPISPLEHINCYARRSLLALADRAGLEPFRLPWKKAIGYRMSRVWMRNPGQFVRTLLESAGWAYKPGYVLLKLRN